MNNLRNKTLFFSVTFGLLSASSNSWSRPPEPDHFIPVYGGEVNIPENSYVDGSSRKGGLQPDYYLDFDHEVFVPIRSFAKSLRESSQLDIWEKIRLIQNFIQENVFSPTAYKDPVYINLLDTVRVSSSNVDQANVRLSDYVLKGRGVCREHAFVLHFALKLAGIENRHVYAKVESIREGEKTLENHAFVSVIVGGRKWVIDSYFSEFNGFLFDDLSQEKGIEIVNEDRQAPFAMKHLMFRKINRILPYPIVWMPKNEN